MNIPFNKPYMGANELTYIKKAFELGKLSGDGEFTKKCENWLENELKAGKALLTPSCTAALEMAAILLNLEPGDEVILPSYTFVSSANAFVIHGATPVFVDIKVGNLNIDENKIESAITKKTKAIVVVHYAGVSCNMDAILEIANRHNLFVIEDAAQAIKSKYKDKFLGSMGHFAALSFHETKNIISGEGGALLINDARFFERAEIIREKGTNRNKFFRGEIDKYTWVDIGSSFLLSEINAAYLWAQLENSPFILKERMRLWQRYCNLFLENKYLRYFLMPSITEDCSHNAHIFYFFTKNQSQRASLLNYLKKVGIGAVFHYVPLHSSDFGKSKGKSVAEDFFVTNFASDTIIRLPLWVGMTNAMQDFIIDQINKWIFSEENR